MGINTAHNPVSSLNGIDGLVVWNLIVAVSLLLTITLWGAEFNIRLSKNLCISETLRHGDVEWTSDGRAALGFSFWLLLPAMFLHLLNAGILGYRQYRLYYSPQSKQMKNLEVRVKETTDGQEMIF